MENFLREPLPELVFGSSSSKVSQLIRRAVAAGKLRKIAPKIYTANFIDTPAEIISRQRYFVLGQLFPNAVISHRSALEGGFSADKTIVLTYKYSKNVRLPGLLIRLVKGPGPQVSDTKFLNGLFIASQARALLENLQISRSRSNQAKTLPKIAIEQRLDKIARVYGLTELNRLREQASALQKILHLETEYQQLTNMISAMLGTHDANVLQSNVAKARATGLAYDPHRLELFATLAAKLKTTTLPICSSTLLSASAKQHFAFFEAYFSNFIEGTEFTIEEAEEIIFHHKMIANRSADSHDILGTYNIVANQADMQQLPTNPETLIQLLQQRHAILMQARLDKNPGQFKTIINGAGNTIFVNPEEVIGTLTKGFDLYINVYQ